MHVPIANIKKKNVQKKRINTEYLYEPFNPFFWERKKRIFPFPKKGKEIYKLRAIHSKGAFSEIKRNTRIPTIQKNRTKKSRNRPNTRSHSTQHQKNKKPLKCNLNLKKIVLFFFAKNNTIIHHFNFLA